MSSQTDRAALRVGVVGCGSIGQIAHLPNVKHLDQLFRLVGVADPSRSRAEWTAKRFHTEAVIDPSQLIEAKGAEALIVASPHASHAEVVLEAVGRGVHVFVEKPLCISSSDGEAIAALADQQGVIVQVGYMKRHDDAFAALCDDLVSEDGQLLLLRATTTEGASLPRSFEPAGLPAPADISDAQRVRWQHDERRQIADAIGSDADDDVAVYRGLFLADLIHDLNLAHAIVDVADEGPISNYNARWWHHGRAGSLDFATSSRVACTIDYVEIAGRSEYEEELTIVTDSSVYRLRFPAPYLHRAPTVYERRAQEGESITTRTFRSTREPYVTELQRFHGSIIDGADCLTSAQSAVADLIALQRAFSAGASANPIGRKRQL